MASPKVITVFIDDEGMTFLMDETVKLFEGEGEVKRASHVEPDSLVFRLLFHTLRHVFGDKGRMSDFTRSWPCLWRVNTKPTAGRILTWGDLPHNRGSQVYWGQNETATWRNRQEAIDAEIVFLNEWFSGEHR